MPPERSRYPTVERADMQSVASGRRDRLARRILVILLAAFVAAGALGWFGYRQRTDAVVAAGFDVRISYPERTRGGLAAAWELTVEREDGAPLPRVEVLTTASYFDAFDHHGITAEPDSIDDDGDVVMWTFEPSTGPRLQITMDMRTQPNARWRHSATTTVVIDGTTVAAFDYTTVVMP